jgi:hypothetical protein
MLLEGRTVRSCASEFKDSISFPYLVDAVDQLYDTCCIVKKVAILQTVPYKRKRGRRNGLTV